MLPAFDLVCLFLCCTDIVSCSAACAECLHTLEHCVLWKEHCSLIGGPWPNWCFRELRHYAYYFKRMEQCWKEYTFRASKTKLDSFQGNSDLADIYPRSDDESRGIDMRKVMGTRDGKYHDWRTSQKTIAYLTNLFGYLPYDYVATIHSTWQSGKSVGLGDIILIRKGIPVARDLCRDAATGFCAMCIGYIYPKGWEGHQPHDYKMHELILSFKAPFASDVAYTVVCHMQQNYLEEGPLGFRHAAAAVASRRPNQKKKQDS